VEEGDVLVRGDADLKRMAGAQRAGTPRQVEGAALPTWGLAMRGALVEQGGPDFVAAAIGGRPEGGCGSAG
jgi:hypothetical protein